MKSIKSIILAALVSFCYTNVSAQGVKIYKKDKTVIEVSYQQLDSIVTFKAQQPAAEEFVDMGLSVKWARCNLGASSPEEFGDYYAWGETETKDSYEWANNEFMGKKMEEISGNPQYDAATAIMGDPVRMPTMDEVWELINNCTFTWSYENDVPGCLVVSSKNNNSIFLPAAGYMNSDLPTNVGIWGNYWTGTPRDIDDNSSSCMYFVEDPFKLDCWWTFRCSGYPIRPVKK